MSTHETLLFKKRHSLIHPNQSTKVTNLVLMEKADMLGIRSGVKDQKDWAATPSNALLNQFEHDKSTDDNSQHKVSKTFSFKDMLLKPFKRKSAVQKGILNPLHHQLGGEGAPDVDPVIEGENGENMDFTQLAAIAQPKEGENGDGGKGSWRIT